MTSLRFSPALSPGPLGIDLLDHEAGRPRQAEACGEVGRDALHVDAEPGPHDLAACLAAATTMRATMLDGVAKPMPTEPPVCE